MPEYLAPGVYVEEVSFRSKSIEGVGTTTTGFIGPTRYGPTDLEPDILTSLGEFERVYGDSQQLAYSLDGVAPAVMMHNYMWHAVRAFFENGGTRLYVVRTYLKRPAGNDGKSKGQLPTGAAAKKAVQIKARFPGELGNIRIRFSLNVGPNVFGSVRVTDANNPDVFIPTIGALNDGDVVWIKDSTAPVVNPPGSGTFSIAESYMKDKMLTWRFTSLDPFVQPPPVVPPAEPVTTLELSDLHVIPADLGATPAKLTKVTDEVRVITLTVTIFPTDPFDLPKVWTNLPLDPLHTQPGTGAPDSFTAVFAESPINRSLGYTLPIIVNLGGDLKTGIDVLNALTSSIPISTIRAAFNSADPNVNDLSVDVVLAGGNDGVRPTAGEYEGTVNPANDVKTGLFAFEDIDDISIVAAPGATFGYESGYNADAVTINSLLISHAERMRYRIAVLDSGDDQSISQVRGMRAQMDSKYAALYYPWVRILDPITRREINLPPSGFVTGIYARNDTLRAVYKAPANEPVALALGFEKLINKGQQDVLNPEGINCFRYFEGRGFRLWGARTISSDPEWKYVNLRRYFIYLEHSIDKSTQWAVFEPNGEALWGNIRRTVEDFLLNEWQSGALLGDKPEKAYFVKCDRSTMTQNDLDNGRLVCQIGVAPLRPAEYVIFRIGQWTADAKRG